MGQERILALFMENPGRDFHIRGIAKELKASKTAVSYHLKKLIGDNLIIKQKKGVFPSLRSNESNEMYLFLKQQDGIRRVIESGLLDYIEKELNPKCVILFGSFAKAEYDKNSDIDIFLQTDEKTVDLRKYEKRLKHRVNLLFEPEIGRLSPELFNNIANGVKLRGFLKIR